LARVSTGTKQVTRDRLLAAAAREFSRLGLERASIDAISVDAGYAKGTVYNYFPSKEELFLAVVEESCAQATDSASAAPQASARVRLRQTLFAFCAWAGAHEGFAKVLVRECLMGTPELHARLIRAEDPLLAEIRAILEEGLSQGEVRDDVPPELLALAISGLTDLALAQHWASDGTSPTLDEIPELVLRLLLDARVPTAAPS
jgi:AcrR family transcriptional regulator